MNDTKRIFSIGIDPGISGGALVVINARLEITAVCCLKAKTFLESARKCNAFLQELKLEWKPLRDYTNVIVGIEDCPLYAKQAEQGKGKQLKNIGAMAGVVAANFWEWTNAGNQIHLISPQEWKPELNLNIKKMADESDYQFKVRKKQASKDFAIKLLNDNRQEAAAKQISYLRHDFAEAVLIARYALNLYR